MLPYRDENQTQRTPVVTIILIALNVMAWIFVQGAGSTLPLAQSICDLGLIPGLLTGVLSAGVRIPIGEGLVCVLEPRSQVLNLFTSMFLHGSWLHLLGNMWFLWLFGNNVEDSMTRTRFLLFYLMSGLAAALLQVWLSPGSATPMVGASGAISGVMGGYLVLYPNVRVWTIVPLGFYVTSLALPAWVMILYWAVLQFFGGLTQIASESAGGVAFWAHVGGFVAGVLLVKPFSHSGHVAVHTAQRWRPRNVGWY